MWEPHLQMGRLSVKEAKWFIHNISTNEGEAGLTAPKSPKITRGIVPMAFWTMPIPSCGFTTAGLRVCIPIISNSSRRIICDILKVCAATYWNVPTFVSQKWWSFPIARKQNKKTEEIGKEKRFYGPDSVLEPFTFTISFNINCFVMWEMISLLRWQLRKETFREVE